MKRLLLTATVLAILAFMGCDLFGGPADYSPLTVGNTWNRRSVGIIEMTDATPETAWTAENRSVVIRTDTLNSGLSVFVLAGTTTVHNMSPDTTYVLHDTSYVQETETAVLSYASKSATYGDTTLALPLEAGKTWLQSMGSVTVVQQENVTVPAGTYKNCWRLDASSGSSSVTLHTWYANHAGTVRSELITTGTGYTSTFITELTSAIIK